MNTVQIAVSAEFAKNLETMRKVFNPNMGTAKAADAFVGWVLRQMIEDKEMRSELFTEVSGWKAETREEALAFGRRLREFCGEKMILSVGAERTDKGWEPILCRTQLEHDIREFCEREGMPFDEVRENFRLKVIELDKAFGLPSRDWMTNPTTNTVEILEMVKVEMDALA